MEICHGRTIAYRLAVADLCTQRQMNETPDAAVDRIDTLFKNGCSPDCDSKTFSRQLGTVAGFPFVPNDAQVADRLPTDGTRKGSNMSQEPLAEIAPNISDQDSDLAKAKRQVAAIKGFYIHLFIFVLVILGLGAINFAVGRPWWVLWVLLGWGIGVLAHALTVFGRTSRRIADWEERKVRQLMSER
jgi:hypothetical protein